MTLQVLYGYGHIPFHFIIPLVFYWYTKNRAQLLQLEAANLIDFDHLFATTIFVADRCSLTTHFLHGKVAALVYIALTMPSATRWLGVGALIHLLLDLPACL